MFPLANKEEKSLGWTISIAFIKKIHDAIPEDDDKPSLEGIESVLLAVMESK